MEMLVLMKFQSRLTMLMVICTITTGMMEEVLILLSLLIRLHGVITTKPTEIKLVHAGKRPVPPNGFAKHMTVLLPWLPSWNSLRLDDIIHVQT